MPSAASARSRRAALLARRRHPSRTRCDLSDTSGLVRSSGLSGQVICPPLANFLSGPAYLFLLLKLVLVHLLLLVRNLWLIGEKGSYQIYTDVLRCYEGDSVEGAIPKRWIPKYRITVYASDVSRLEPDAPPVELLFFGEVGQSLVGKPTILLVSNARGNDNGPLHHSPPGDIGQSASGSFQELGSTGSTATLVTTASNVLTTDVTTAMLAPSIATPPPQTTPPSVLEARHYNDICPDDHLSDAAFLANTGRKSFFKDCFYSWQTFVS
uniref:Uncharacterized protein n=1 Tax=Oryza punctata TaxID=4537 RepID=A0A0E0LZD3_ORYPU